MSVAALQDVRSPKPGLLVVPHIYAEHVSIREIEFARRLARYFDTYCLAWDDALLVDGPRSLSRRSRQFRTALGAALSPTRLRGEAGAVTYVRAPVCQPILLQRFIGMQRALDFCQFVNGRMLARIIRRCGIEYILLSGGYFRLPKTEGVHGFYDIVDWFPEDTLPPEKSATQREQIRRLSADAERVFAVSEPLAEKLTADFGIRAVPLPNGADIASLRSVPVGQVAELRHRLGLNGKFVIGYIGNLGSFTGVDFLLDAFRAVRLQIPEAALLLVGPAEYWRERIEAARGEGVVWTGAVAPRDVGAYFCALDVGVLPKEKTLGTELAFQLKIVEYSACRKFVVATPLRTLERLAWPNVILAELRVDAWVEALVRARRSEWRPEWDPLVEPYDWSVLADRIASVMLGDKMLATEDLPCAS
ncbi:MAG: glycosyltransferase [Candidatus Acidiferrales bacterium]